MENRKKALIYMLISTISFAFMGVFVKSLREVPLMEKVLFRNLISLLVALWAIKRSSASIFGKKENQFLLIARSILGLSGVSLIFYAISHLTLADSAIFMRLSPFFVTLFAAFFLKEEITKVQVPALILAFGGSIMIIKPGFSMTLLPSIAGFFAAACAGGAYTLVSHLKTKEQPVTIVFYFSMVSVIISLPFVFLNFYCPSLWEAFFLLLTGISAASGQIFLTSAYRYSAASEVSVYNYAGIIFSALLGFLIWQEVPDLYTVMGGFLIVGSGWLVYRSKMVKNQ